VKLVHIWALPIAHMPVNYISDSDISNIESRAKTRRFATPLLGGMIFLIIVAACSPTSYEEPTSVATIAPSSTVRSGRVTLFSNFDPGLPVDLTMKNAVNLEYEQAFFDFDSAQITTDDGSDIYLAVSCGTSCFEIILAINGAMTILRFRDSQREPGFEGCRQALQEEREAVSGISPVPGDYSCLQTNEGNTVQILAIENEAHSKNAKFVFEYVLWSHN